MGRAKSASRNTGVNRRQFLRGSAAAAAATTLVSPLAFLRTRAMAQGMELCGTRGPSPYGPLVPAKDAATGLELIMLPKGFHYTTFSWKGDMMDDGNLCPSGHDGRSIVASANPGGLRHSRAQTYTLIRNHEVYRGLISSPMLMEGGDGIS